MAPRRRNASQISSPRYRVLRQDRLNIQKITSPEVFKEEKLAPGEEQLFSSNIPGLRGGSYTVKVRQSIIARENDKETPLDSKQAFSVHTPCFNLTPDTIYSFYPPSGHGVGAQVLPHVVFNDSMLPWERFGSINAESSTNQPTDYPLNRVPWLAVFVFTQEELLLSPVETKAIFKNTQLGGKATQSPTLSVEISVADIENILNDDPSKGPTVVMPMNPKNGLDNETAKVVLIKQNLFNDIFRTSRTDTDVKPQDNPDVSQHRFLAHVRHINTTGMADADDDEKKRERGFGIIVSNRTGPFEIQQPTTVIVHLLSIEGVEQLSYPVSGGFVAMSSLHSWTYTCLPANSFNIADAFKDVGNSVRMLRSLKLPTIDPNETDIPSRVRQRLEDGFTLVQYRTQTGEVTAAITRGPLTPKKIMSPLTDDWKLLSTSGSDLQIFDRGLGLMDITYSTAWHLGRTLALGDQAFTTALLRVRNLILKIADQEAKIQVLANAGIGFKDRKETVRSLAASLDQLQSLPSSGGLYQAESMLNRWSRSSTSKPDLSYQSTMFRQMLPDQVHLAAETVASTTDDYKDQKKHPYDEHNTPYSTDWMLVLRWILDKFYLISVPWHYLLPDPSCLATTSLSFFHIDMNWVDALVDGGLSLANHIDSRDDLVRCGIKDAVNWYLKTRNNDLNYPRSLPRYGCFLRSELVIKFPDLLVTAHPIKGYKPPTAVESPVILRQDVVGKDTLFLLFSEAPGTERFNKLTFAQPAHQQAFAAGKELNATTLSGQYRKIFSVYTESENNILEPFEWKLKDAGREKMYDWTSRTLQAGNVAHTLFTKLKLNMGSSFSEKFESAAMIGIQLNDPCYQLDIVGKDCGENDVQPLSLTYKDLRPKISVTNICKHQRGTSPRRVCDITPAFHERARAVPLEYDPPPHTRVPRPISLYPLPGEAHEWDSPEKKPRSSTPSTPTTPRTPTSPWTPNFPLTPTTPLTHEGRDRANSWDSTTSSELWENMMMDPAGPPVFEISVHPASKPSAGAIELLDYPQDLIFAVNYIKGAQQFMLKSITISLPIIHFKNLSSAAMLSNLRFNPRIVLSSQGEEFRIVLLPRSRKGSVAVSMISEMSFLMNQVLLKGKAGLVIGTVHLSYLHGYLEQKIYLTLKNAELSNRR